MPKEKNVLNGFAEKLKDELKHLWLVGLAMLGLAKYPEKRKK